MGEWRGKGRRVVMSARRGRREKKKGSKWGVLIEMREGVFLLCIN